MATYAIGDLQGCYSELLDLLNAIQFDEDKDNLWFTGDLVNRGPESLQALRFVHDLRGSVTVLGNHDLHLLAVAGGHTRVRRSDTLDPVLQADDRDSLLDWLRRRPLIYRDQGLGYTLVHAGLLPQWSISRALDLARDVERILAGKDAQTLFEHMYGDGPNCWSDNLDGWERVRFVINCFTRMRFCDSRGCLALQEKGPPGSSTREFSPWYEAADRKSAGERIIFGHWSTIHLGDRANFQSHGVFPLDTGCVWGGSLTAMRLDDGRTFSVPSRQPPHNGAD